MAKDRFKAKPGNHQMMGFTLPTLQSALYKVALTLPAEAKPVVKEKKVSRPIKIPDATVLAIRRAHRDGTTFKELTRLYPEVKPDTIRQFIDYVTRTNLLLPEDRIKK